MEVLLQYGALGAIAVVFLGLALWLIKTQRADFNKSLAQHREDMRNAMAQHREDIHTMTQATLKSAQAFTDFLIVTNEDTRHVNASFVTAIDRNSDQIQELTRLLVEDNALRQGLIK